MNPQEPTKKFDSQIPDYLLTGETPAMQYLLVELSKNTQAIEYLLKKREESGCVLEEISNKLEKLESDVKEVDTKLKYTNGCIGESKISIHLLEEKAKNQLAINLEIDEVVKFKNFVQKYLLNRVALGVFIVFFLGGVKVASNVELRELLFKIVGMS